MSEEERANNSKALEDLKKKLLDVKTKVSAKRIQVRAIERNLGTAERNLGLQIRFVSDVEDFTEDIPKQTSIDYTRRAMDFYDPFLEGSGFIATPPATGSTASDVLSQGSGFQLPAMKQDFTQYIPQSEIHAFDWVDN